MYKEVILSRLKEYLEKKKWIIKKSGKVVMLLCPFCKKEPLSANVIPNTNIVNCFSCNKKYNLLDIAKEIEEKFPSKEEEQLQYLKQLLKIDVVTKKDEDEIVKLLDFYEKNKFSLIPIIKNTKVPIPKEWQNTSYKDKKEWLGWINNGLNIGLITGRINTVLDLDILTKKEKIEFRLGKISENRKRELLAKREKGLKLIYDKLGSILGDPLVQENLGGQHLVYKYEVDLPKTSVKIEDIHIDIENKGGYILIEPSKLGTTARKFKQLKEIPKMPEELKKLLLSKIDLPNLKTNSEKIIEAIKTEDFKIKPEDFKLKNNNLEGCCNSSFIKLGGILRKELNLKQTEFVLNIFNNHLLEDPMEQKAINNMIRELDKYVQYDEQELALKVLQYLRDAEDATRTDVQRALEEKKIRIDKVLNYLVREGYLVKRGRSYHIIKKADWKYSLINVAKKVPFKVPYFHDVANFNWGDLILIGSKNKRGKTHIAMNIVKRLVEQGVKPYYISLETGSRFTEIALQLGLKEDDFGWDEIADPTKIELEPNAVTIIDWLLIVDKAKTDLVFRHFVEQLHKTNGFLFIFQQLKHTKDNNNQFFAPNMAMQFPSLAVRYIYDQEGEGTYGSFEIDATRDPKSFGRKTKKLPCKYDYMTKLLKRIDELDENKEEEK